jgi:fibronectin type 3 domain-containing protein
VVTGFTGNIKDYPVGMIGIYRHDGTVHSGWPKHIDGVLFGGVEGKVVLGDLNNDNKLEIVAPTTSGSEEVFVWNERGEILPGWPRRYQLNFWDIMLADVDNNGFQDIVFSEIGSSDPMYMTVHVWDVYGRSLPGWPVRIPLSGEQSFVKGEYGVAAGDVAGDEFKEIIITTLPALSGNSYNSYIECRLIILGHTGEELVNQPVSNAFKLSAPVLGDIDNDGDLEIITGGKSSTGGKVYVFQGNGTMAEGWPREIIGDPSFVSLADFNHDGYLEIVAGTSQDWFFGENSITIFDYSGNIKPGWPVYFDAGSLGMRQGPVIADINGDGDLEIMASQQYFVEIPFSEGGALLKLYAWDENGTPLAGYPRLISAYSGSVDSGASPSISDLNRDGKVDVIIPKAEADRSFIIAFSTVGDYDENRMAWPVYRHDPQHTSRYTQPSDSAAGTVSGYVILQNAASHSTQVTFELLRPGTSTISGNASNDEDPILPGTQITTGTDGSYILKDIPPKAYDIAVQGQKWLREKKTNVVVQAGSITRLDFFLPGGDANYSNSVDSEDLNILKVSYGKSQGQSGYDERADFDNSGSVNVLDLNILRGNYSKKGNTFPPWLPDPSSLTAAVLSSSKIMLSWQDNSERETYFIIERSLNGSEPFTLIANAGKNITTYTDSGLTPETAYSYRVRAYDYLLNQYSGYSNIASAATPSLPVPSNLTATAISSSQIRLSWKDNSDNESGFKIERGSSSPGPFELIASAGTGITTYTDRGLIPETTYYYRVRAYHSSTGESSSYTNVAVATSLPSSLPAPADLVAAAISSSQIGLAWRDKSDNESGFRIERGLNSSGPFTEIVFRAANSTSYTDSMLAPETTYYYRIRAYNSFLSEYSAYSDIVYATTPAVRPLFAPSNLTAEAISGTRIRLEWQDNSPDEAGFEIERSLGDSGIFVPITTSGPNIAAYIDKGLTAETTYHYRVRAYNIKEKSAYCNVASATTPGVLPLFAPSNLVAVGLSGSQINLDWQDDSLDETGIEIERSAGGSGAFIQIATVKRDVTAYIDSGLTPGGVYHYRARAFNGRERSGYSNIASAIAVFPSPSSLTATAASPDQIHLNWQDNSVTENYFEIERGLDDSGPFVQIASVGPNVTSYIDTGLNPGTAHYYRVRAYNFLTGYSGYSETTSAATPDEDNQATDNLSS